MKVLRLVLLLLVVSPGTALASGTTLAAHDVRPGVNRPVHRFDLVGLHWKGSGASRSGRERRGTLERCARSARGRRADARTHELRANGWQLGSPY
jgi:hypothetical protein